MEVETDPTALPVTEAYARLATRAHALLERRSAFPSPTIVRLVHSVRPVDPIGLVRALPADRAALWQSRGDRDAVAGSGVALEVNARSAAALADAARILRGSGARALLTGRFDGTTDPDADWAPFGTVRAWLPLIEVVRSGDRFSLAINVPVGPGTPSGRVAADVPRTISPRTERAALPTLEPVTSASHQTDRWGAAIDAILERVADRRLRKAVLADVRDFDAADALDPLAVTDRLLATHTGTYLFCIRHDRTRAFLGASPEVLFTREGRLLESEALAGTRPRGETPGADEALADELRASAKDHREHQHVRDYIRERLAGLSRTVEFDADPYIRALPYVQHLRSGIRAELSPGTTDADLLAALHPTPAVCGLPVADARRLIARLEGFDRGLYGGVVGWFGDDRSECAVAIRSGLVTGRRLRLFAGAGIVDGSTAAAEWDEVANKLDVFACVFGVPARALDHG